MGAQRLWAQIIGIVLVLVGILGFFMTNPLLGLFEINTVHNVIHILSGLVFLWAGFMSGPVKKVNQWLGIIYILVAILGFLGYADFLMETGGNMMYDNYLHAAIGIISVLIGFMAAE